MPAMLKHKKTGNMYVYTKLLAARSDMTEVDVPDIAPGKEFPQVAKKAAVEKETPKSTVKKDEIKVESGVSLKSLFNPE
jgi:hypothetical protein